MPLTQITADSIADSAITAQKLNPNVPLGGPKITAVQVTNSSYTALDDTAVALSGGFIRIVGSGFTSGASVIVGSAIATSVTYESPTAYRAQLPAQPAGSYTVFLIASDGATATRPLGITYSETPIWVTSTTLTNASSGAAYSTQLSATGATSYALAAGSTLPTGLTLSSTGLLSGTVTVSSTTTYNFTINAIDAELQDSPRTFSLSVGFAAVGQQTFTTNGTLTWTVPANVTSISAVVVGGGGGGCSSFNGGSGGGGGDLRWMNNISVTPGEILNIGVGPNGAFGGTEGGTGGGESVVARQNWTYIVSAQGGGGGRQSTSGGTPGTKTGTSSIIGGNIGGGNGGLSTQSTTTTNTGGGGGAGGYSGDGGFCGVGSGGGNGTGGGGGGGGGAAASGTGARGGGVGLLGEGASGSGGGPGGTGGSGGAGDPGSPNATGQYYGAGGGGSDTSSFNATAGQQGAVRIIWGPNRAFPSTNTGNL